MPSGRRLAERGKSDAAKMLRLESLKVKAELERELETWVPNCTKCGLDVHWVSGLGVSPGHWAHREPAPHGEPDPGSRPGARGSKILLSS